MNYTGNITKNITWAMATTSGTAKKLGISNQPVTALHAQNIKKVCELLEQINSLLHPIGGNFKISINSIYRSPAVNKIVGGSTTSSHMQGLAADIKSTVFSPELLFKKIRALFKAGKLKGIDQVILEPTWVHIGTKTLDSQVRGQFLIKRKGQAIRAATKAELGE
jgi:zinc D-Ala-D-Ala carboxypeptidase